MKRSYSIVSVPNTQESVKRVKRVARVYKRRVAGASAKRLISTLAKEPFPKEWNTNMTWSPDTYLLAPGAASGAVVVRVNDLFDPDYSNVFGNNQPLFSDQIMSATGPYQLFRVNNWKCKITLHNASGNGGGASGALPLDCYIAQGAISSTDVDTLAELKATPGRMTFLLPQRDSGGCKTVYINGSAKAFTPGSTAEDIDYCGTYQTSPAKPIFLGIGVANAYTSDASSIQCYIKFEIQYNVTFFSRDGVTS